MSGIEWFFIYLILGACVGFIAGLLGAGGGGILVPLLVSFFSYQGMKAESLVHLSLGTAFACMIVSSIASLRAHAQQSNVLWKYIFSMAPGIIAGTFLTAQIAVYLKSVWIALFFSVFMAVIAVQLFSNWKPTPKIIRANSLKDFFVGLGIGSVSALAAVGGGFLTVFYLTYQNVDIKKAVGTSAAIGFPIAIAGTVGYAISGWNKNVGDAFSVGFIYLPAFVAISLGSFFLAPIGAKCSAGLPEKVLKKIFAVICVLLSVKMLWTCIEIAGFYTYRA